MAFTTCSSIDLPSFHGYFLDTDNDANLLLEFGISGRATFVPPPFTKQQSDLLIKSGNLFIFNSTGMKKWVDGKFWSHSQVDGNYTIYQELDSSRRKGGKQSRGVLIRKIARVKVGVESYCLVSYYTKADVDAKTFITPSEDNQFQNITIRPGLAITLPKPKCRPRVLPKPNTKSNKENIGRVLPKPNINERSGESYDYYYNTLCTEVLPKPNINGRSGESYDCYYNTLCTDAGGIHGVAVGEIHGGAVGGNHGGGLPCFADFLRSIE